MVWTSVNQWTPNKVRNGWFNVTLRQVMQAAGIDANGSKVRFTFQAPAGNGLRIRHCFVGKVAGNNPMGAGFKEAPVRVTFSGAKGFTIAAGDDIVSDEVTFDYAFADGDALVVSWYVPNDGAGYGSSVGKASIGDTTVHYAVGNYAGSMPSEMGGNIFRYVDDFQGMSVVKTEIFKTTEPPTVVKTLNLEWDNAGATNIVVSTLDLLWDTATAEAFVEISKFSAYPIADLGSIAAVSKYSAYPIADLGDIAAISKVSLYFITTTDVISSLGLVWDVDGPVVNSSLDLLWNVQSDTIQSNLQLLWNDAAASIPFIRTLNLRWSVDGPITVPLDLKWNVLGGPIERNLQLLWNVYNNPVDVDYILSSLSLNWDVGQSFVDPSRVVYPDAPILETWAFQTSIFRSRSGKEQRRSHYRNPIVTMQYSALVLDNEDFRDLRKAVEIDTTSFYPVPLFQYYAFLDAQASASDTRLYFDVIKVNPVIGGYLAICDDELRDTVFIEIVDVHADGCTLASPIGINTTEVNFVAPVRICRISTDGQARLAPVHANATYVFVSVDRDQNFLREGITADFIMMGERIVLDKAINADENINEDYLSGNDVIDNGKSTPLMFVNEPTRRRFSLRYLINDLFDAPTLDWWRVFAFRTCGQWKAFGLPTYRADADLSTPAIPGDNVISLLGSATYDVFTAGGYIGLMFDTAAGREYREVLEVELDGTNTLVTLSEPISSVPGGNDFDTVSFVMLVRLSEDKITIAHGKTSRMVEFQVQMVQE